MRIFLYNSRIYGQQGYFLGIGFSVLVVIVAMTGNGDTWDAFTRLDVGARYLGWIMALLAAVLGAGLLHPEEPQDLEMTVNTCKPVSHLVLERMIACHVSLCLPAWAALASIIFLGHLDPIWFLPGAAIILTNILVFSGIAILASAYSRYSLAGMAGAVLGVILLTLVNLPDIYVALNFFVIRAAFSSPELFWGGKLIFSMLGCLALIFGLRRFNNTDVLLTGTGKASGASQRKQKQPRNHLATFLAQMIPVSNASPNWGVLYEALQLASKGVIPIAMLSLTFIMGFLAISGGNWLYSLAINFPRGLLIFSILVLPPLVCDLIPTDRRANVDQLVLSSISSSQYFRNKLGAAVMVVILTVFLGSIPFTFLLFVASLQGQWQYLMAYSLIWICAVIPFLIYWPSLAGLIGSLSGSRSAFGIGIAISVLGFAVYGLTATNMMGNLLFPAGTAVIETLGALVQTAPTIGNNTFIVSSLMAPAPWYLIPLFSISGILQVFILFRFILLIQRKKGQSL